VRLVFLGTPRIAVPTFSALIDAGHEIILVVTQPDRPSGRSRTPAAPPVKAVALQHGLEVIQPAKVRTAAFRESIASRKPDALVVVAYGRILPGKVLRTAPLGAVNVHFSLLPLYRGAAPVQWALARGESVTGVTTMLMNERMDEGDILMQREVAVEPGEHAPELQERLAAIGAELLPESLSGLESGSLVPRPQDHALATMAPIINKSDGEIDPALHAREIEGRMRGFDPWPGVWLRRSGRRLRLIDGRVLDAPPRQESAGSVVELTAEGLVMVCGDGSSLLLTKVQPEGRRALSARDAVNGRQLEVGDRLEKAPGPAEGE
jgi:methionyl-tRNA formyltransferase